MAPRTSIDEKPVGVHYENVDPVISQTGHLTNQEDHEETVRQAVARHPWTAVWCLYCVWIFLVAAFDNQAGGFVLSIPQFRKDFGSPFEGNYVLPAQWQSAYSGGPVAAAVLGSFGAGFIADRIGRKPTIAVAYAITFIGVTLEFIATTNSLFFAGKLLNGFAIGGLISVTFTYLGEITPLALRGILTATGPFMFALGSFLVYLIINYQGDVSSRWAYRGPFIGQYAITAIALLIFPFMPESPWWLIAQNKNEKAVRALKCFGLSAEEIEKRIAVIKLTLEKSRHETENSSYLECFRNTNLRRTMIAIAPLSIQALSGIYFVLTYNVYYIQLVGYSTSDSFKIALAAQVCSMVGNIGSWFLVDRVGRRSLTLWGTAIVTVILWLIGGLATAGTPDCIKGVVALLCLYNFAFNITIGATAYSALAEIATARLRAKTASLGLALQNALYTMWGFVIPYLFNPDKANLGAKTSFIFAGLGVLSVIYLHFCHPEVAGRNYEEIDEMFMKRVPTREFRNYQTETEMADREIAAQVRRRTQTEI
ncbi:MFS hexose transporter [Ilyonectria destructans]|nr:MFS hexose transporter [Ilyonectria destructans]